MKKIYLLSVLGLFLLAGCRTPEFHQDRAVQKSREFLLKKCPQLSYEESSYIRYNKPVILHNNIIGGVNDIHSSRIAGDMNQIQIVWNIPGKEFFYIVWGVSSASMQDFTPEKVFIRKFYPEDTNRKNAVKRARAYIIGNLFSTLSVADYNDLRFREPEIFFSKTELEKEYMPQKDEFQFAFVWTLQSDPAKKVTVFGNGRKNLAAFAPRTGSVISADDLKNTLLDQYQSPPPPNPAKAVENTVPQTSGKETAKEVKKAPRPAEKGTTVVSADVKTPPVPAITSESTKNDSDIWGDKEPAKEEKIIDDLPEAPELDTENDLKEPAK